jgi:hypothetical protein
MNEHTTHQEREVASRWRWMVDAYVVVFAGQLLTRGAAGDPFGRKLLPTLGASWPEGLRELRGCFLAEPTPVE